MALVWSRGTAVTRPSARWQPALGYTNEDESIILFGGQSDGTGYMSDTWKFKNGVWTELNPSTVPNGRYGALMCADTANSRVIMFGGWYGGVSTNFYSDIWEYSSGDWTCLRAQGEAGNPSYHSDNGLAVDTANGKAYVLDGNVLQEFDFTSGLWTPYATGEGSNGRNRAGVAFNPDDGLVYIFAGYTDVSPTQLYTILTFNPSTSGFAYATPSGTDNIPGSNPWGRPFFYSSIRSKLITVRERAGTAPAGATKFEMWELNTAVPAWDQVYYSDDEEYGPPPRDGDYAGSYMVENPADEQILTFGGNAEHGFTSLPGTYHDQYRWLHSGTNPTTPAASNPTARWVTYLEDAGGAVYDYGATLMQYRAHALFSFLVDILGFTVVQQSAAGGKTFDSSPLVDSGSDGVFAGGNFDFSAASAAFTSGTPGQVLTIIDPNDHRNTDINRALYYVNSNTVSIAKHPQGTGGVLSTRRWPTAGTGLSWKLYDRTLGPNTNGDWFVVRTPHASGFEVKVELVIASYLGAHPSYLKITVAAESGSWNTGTQDWNSGAPVLTRWVPWLNYSYYSNTNGRYDLGSVLQMYGKSDGSVVLLNCTTYDEEDHPVFGVADEAEAGTGMSARERVFLMGYPNTFTTMSYPTGQVWSDALWEPVTCYMAGARALASYGSVYKSQKAFYPIDIYHASSPLHGVNARSGELDSAPIFIYTTSTSEGRCPLRGIVPEIRWATRGGLGSFERSQYGQGRSHAWLSWGPASELSVPWSG